MRGYIAAWMIAAGLCLAQQSTTTGTVSDVKRNSVTIRTPDGRYMVFETDKNTTRPANLAAGANVTVTWTQGEDPNVRIADNISTTQGGTAAQPEAVPPQVRNVERSIERNFRRYRIGFRGGFTLNPETVEIGTHMQVGPFFSNNLFFRPNVAFSYGEVTTLFAINPEAIYNLPMGRGSQRWFYVGLGPGFNFVEQSLNRTAGSDRVNFSNFNFSPSLNILAGAQYRSGFFAEIRSSVYAAPAPVLHLLIGYTF